MPRIGIGLFAARPAPGQAGTLYVATDRNDEWSVDDGVAWRTMGAFGLQMVAQESGNLLLLGASAAGAGAQKVLALGRATTPPTDAPLDGAVLDVEDLQGVAGRAALIHLSEDGVRTPLDPVLFRGKLVIINTTGPGTETTLWTTPPTVKGGTLVGRYAELMWHGEASNQTGAVRTLTLRLKFGGTTLATVVCTNVLVGSGQILHVLFRLDCPVASSQQAVPLAIVGQGTVTATAGFGAADATVDQPLDLTAEWNFSSVSLEVRTLALDLVLR